MSEHEKDQMAEIDNIEIEPLSDDALESVAGGTSDGSSGSCCSCCNCSSAAAKTGSLGSDSIFIPPADPGCSP
jgi:hypothetical protein